MSDQTKAALEDAIFAHIADECDGDLTGAWVLVAECVNLERAEDGISSFYTDVPHAQSNFLTTGLLYRAVEQGQFHDAD